MLLKEIIPVYCNSYKTQLNTVGEENAVISMLQLMVQNVTTWCLFRVFPEHRSYSGMFRRMKAFYALQLPYWKKGIK